jgi:NADH-quinone oxidoreductase subunit C
MEEGRAGLEPPSLAPRRDLMTKIASTPIEQDPIIELIRTRHPDAIAAASDFCGELTLEIPRDYLVLAAEFLRAEPALQFDFLSDITAVDRFPVEPRFELNYHLLSIPHRRILRLRVWVSGTDSAVGTVTPVWPTANWHEREIFDLFGIRFHGHPDLRRILMPDDWEGHPLRKDYPVEGFRQ